MLQWCILVVNSKFYSEGEGGELKQTWPSRFDEARSELVVAI